MADPETGLENPKLKFDPMNNEFWRHKTLGEMTPQEWEAVCDGCGRCCLHKLEDEDTHEVVYTCVSCRLLDTHTCRCREYANRKTIREECIHLTPDHLETMEWLPASCGYRLLYEGRDLPSWHPLVSGDPESIHTYGISLRNKAISEEHVAPEELAFYIIDMD